MVNTRRAILWGLAVLVCGGLIGWAVAVATRPPQQVAAEATYVLVAAQDGEVGQSVSTVVTATWPARNVAANQSDGTITRLLVDRGDRVQAGDVLYRVDERPVAVLEGSVPAFRSLQTGVVGADVRQLSNFLVNKKYLGAKTSTYSNAVQQAVRAWQRSLGVKQTGQVQRGDVVFVKTLPMRVALDSKFAVGEQVSVGAPSIQAFAGAPVFTAQYSDFQAKQVAEGMPVIVQSGSQAWNGSLGALKVAADGSVTASVEGNDGTALCGTQCSKVPLSGTAQLRGTTEVQKTVRGVVVPLAALITDADGSTAVIAADGQRLPVTVLARARGMAVVQGVRAGTSVRVPGQ